MKDIFSRVLGVLAILVGVATLVALYFVWGLWVDQTADLSFTAHEQARRVQLLEEGQWRAEQRALMRGVESGTGSSVDPDAPAAVWTGEREFVPEYYNGGDGFVLNTDPPTETVEYADDNWGFRVQLPFNPAWGNARYKLHPYEAFDVDGDGKVDVVEFGVLAGGEGGLGRWRYLFIQEPMTKAEVLMMLAEDETLPKNITTIDFGAFEAIAYDLTAVLGGPISELIVLGRRAMYRVAPPFGDEARAELLEIARSLREE